MIVEDDEEFGDGEEGEDGSGESPNPESSAVDDDEDTGVFGRMES